MTVGSSMTQGIVAGMALTLIAGCAAAPPAGPAPPGHVIPPPGAPGGDDRVQPR